MTDRERWIVYPLLFLALGVSLRDKITREISTDALRCKRLVVEDLAELPRTVIADESGRVFVELTASTFQDEEGTHPSGVIRTYDHAGRTVAALGPRCTVRDLQVLTPQGRVLLTLGSLPALDAPGDRNASGSLVVYGADRQPVASVSSDHSGTGGMISTFSSGRLQTSLQTTWDAGEISIHDPQGRTLLLGYENETPALHLRDSEGKTTKLIAPND